MALHFHDSRIYDLLLNDIRDGNNSGITPKIFIAKHAINAPGKNGIQLGSGNVFNHLARTLCNQRNILICFLKGLVYLHAFSASQYCLPPPPLEAKLYAAVRTKATVLIQTSSPVTLLTSTPFAAESTKQSRNRQTLSKKEQLHRVQHLKKSSISKNSTTTSTPSAIIRSIFTSNKNYKAILSKSIIPRNKSYQYFITHDLAKVVTPYIQLQGLPGGLKKYMENKCFFFATSFVESLNGADINRCRARNHPDRGNSSEVFITINKSLNFVDDYLCTPDKQQQYLDILFKFMTKQSSDTKTLFSLKQLL